MKRTTTSGATSAAAAAGTGARLLGAGAATIFGVAGLWGAMSYLPVLLTSPLRIDALTTAAVVTLGAALAAWYTLSAALAWLCLLARLVGLVWAGGEAWLQRQGAPLVRRLVSGAGGAALVAGALITPAYAGAADQTEPPPVTWTPADSAATDGPGGTADNSGDTAGAGPGNRPDARVSEPTSERSVAAPDQGTSAAGHEQNAAAGEGPAASPGAEDESDAPAGAGPAASAGGEGEGNVPGGEGDALAGESDATTSAAVDGATSPGAGNDAAPPALGVEPGSSTTEQGPGPPAGDRGANAPHGTDRPAGHAADRPPAQSVSAQTGTALGAPEQTSTPGPDIRVVEPGDTLWSLAAEHLGPGATDAQIAAAWPRWHEENVDVIGPDPNLIHPHQALHVPGGSR